MLQLLPRSHRILERPHLAYRPFGKDAQGNTIQDVSGITVRANLEYLEDLIARQEGPEAAEQALSRLVTLLNERIPDPSYHVTLDFLKNPWNSYSYEFVMFLAEFSIQLSRQDHFHFNMGREKFLSPIIQILGRPFSIIQIYRMYPYFVEKFTKGSLKPEVVSVRNGQAVMRLKFSEHASEQFGPYFQGCAERICHTTKATIAEVPARMFGRRAATIQDVSCMAQGAPYCEWIFTWDPQRTPLRPWHIASGLVGLLTWGLSVTLIPTQPLWVSMALALVATCLMQLAGRLWVDRKELEEQRKIIQEQLESAEHQHEDLREAYAKQEHILVEVRRRVEELTMLHQLTLIIGSTLDKQTIINAGLEAIVGTLHYPHAWFAAWNFRKTRFQAAQVVMGASTVRKLEDPVEMPDSVTDFLNVAVNCGEPTLHPDGSRLWGPGHPMSEILGTDDPSQGCLALPMKSQNQVLGVIVVGQKDTLPFGIPEKKLLSTVAHQITIALDSALAYEEIEALNLGLEGKVKARTIELQDANTQLAMANERLKELDRMKSQFLSHCSHELRTPLTSIKGFTENLLRGMVGGLSERQELYLNRINANSDRLTRMIGDLLDLSRIEAGTVRLNRTPLCLQNILEDATQELLPLIESKEQQLVVETEEHSLSVMGDSDRLHQIITNLVHNAHKFTPAQGTIRIHAHHALPQHIVLTVSDTGPGISQEAQKNLFDPFFQAHRKPEIGTQGLGLGLSIVRQLVELHGGSISVDSQEGMGTTFKILLPSSEALPPT
ncbi:MAG: ATP-binding protein [Nitrospirales bacterium]